MAFREVRDPRTGRLLCRYDPERDLIEFCERRVKTLIDLRQFRDPRASSGAPEPARAADGQGLDSLT